MLIYNYDKEFFWNFVMPEEEYSDPFNKLLMSHKSTMTEKEAIDFSKMVFLGNEKSITKQIKRINDNRKKFLKRMNTYFDKFNQCVKENRKVAKNFSDLEPDEGRALIYFNKYVYKKKNLEQLVMDAFPYESLFAMRY